MNSSYIILGDPIPLARPRMSGPSRIVYDSQKLLKHSLIHQLLKQRGDTPLLSGALHLDVTFYLKIPKLSLIKMKEKVGQYHVYKPDLDNLIKMILDVASMKDFDDVDGVLMHDDCIVSSINAKKIYDLEPRTVFTLSELK